MASFASVLAALLPLVLAGSAGRTDTAPCHAEDFRPPCAGEERCMLPATGTITGTLIIGSEDPTLIASLNSVRSSYGLPALSESASLSGPAKCRLAEIRTLMSHTRPDGRDCHTVFSDYGLSPDLWGENLAAGYAFPEEVLTAWLASETHRENLLDPRFTQAGFVHMITDDAYGDYWVLLLTN